MGGEKYAEENETFVAPLQVRHVRVDGDQFGFVYRAKSSVKRTVVVKVSEIRATTAETKKRWTDSRRKESPKTKFLTSWLTMTPGRKAPVLDA